jgi:acetyl esterase/lipase
MDTKEKYKMKKIKRVTSLILMVLLLIISLGSFTQVNSINYQTVVNISYKNDKDLTDDYSKSRCLLDICYPVDQKGFATIVWFHGGSLLEGEKFFPPELMNKGFAIIAVNYRLSPMARNPAYIEDAAASVAWAFNNIEHYGGDKNKIFIAGHSVGGYLTLMVGLDPQWLGKYNIDTKQIAGLFPISGQTITHTTIREERSLDKRHRIADEYSPLYYTRGDAAPLFLITGDRNLEIKGRYEESALLNAYMKSMNDSCSQLFELQGFDHVSVAGPACYIIVDKIKKIVK